MSDRKLRMSFLVLLALTACCINSGCTYLLTPSWTHDKWIAYYQRRIKENRQKLKHCLEMRNQYAAEVSNDHGVPVDELTHEQLHSNHNYSWNEIVIRDYQNEITSLEDKIDRRRQAQRADRLAAVRGHRYRHRPISHMPTHGGGHHPTVKPKPPTCPHHPK